VVLVVSAYQCSRFSSVFEQQRPIGTGSANCKQSVQADSSEAIRTSWKGAGARVGIPDVLKFRPNAAGLLEMTWRMPCDRSRSLELSRSGKNTRSLGISSFMFELVRRLQPALQFLSRHTASRQEGFVSALVNVLKL